MHSSHATATVAVPTTSPIIPHLLLSYMSLSVAADTVVVYRCQLQPQTLSLSLQLLSLLSIVAVIVHCHHCHHCYSPAVYCDFCAPNKDTDRFKGECLLPWLEGQIYVPKDGFLA
jgi:hypothetical protein